MKQSSVQAIVTLLLTATFWQSSSLAQQALYLHDPTNDDIVDQVSFIDTYDTEPCFENDPWLTMVSGTVDQDDEEEIDDEEDNEDVIEIQEDHNESSP